MLTQCKGCGQRDVLIPGHATTLITSPHPLDKEDAQAPLTFRVTYDGAKDAIRVFGFVSDNASALPIRFYDPASTTDSALAAIGLKTDRPTHVVVGNNAATSVTTTLNFYPVDGSLSASQTRSINLAPFEASYIDVTDALAGLAASGVLRATITVEQGSKLVGAVTQELQAPDGAAVLEDIPFKTSNPLAFMRGAYPLRWEDDYRNAPMVVNSSEEAMRVRAYLIAAGTTYALPIRTLQPHTTAYYDVDTLKKSGTPDGSGHVIPPGALSGKFHWAPVTTPDHVVLGLQGRTELSSALNKRASSFSCGAGCNYESDTFPLFDVDLLGEYPDAYSNGMQNVTAHENYYDAYGNQVIYSNVQNFYWNINIYDSNIMSLTSVSDTAMRQDTGVPGTTNVQWREYSYSGYQYLPDANCEYQDNSSDMSGAGTTPVPADLSCSVTQRGGITSCGINGTGARSVRDWVFTDGANAPVTASTGSSSTTWTGNAVQTGIVQATLVGGDGVTKAVSTTLSVFPRNWHTDPPSPVEVPNGQAGGLILPVPPSRNASGSDSGLGYSYFFQGADNTPYEQVPAGPNAGYVYVTGQPALSVFYRYEINPDLENASSQFFQAQTGSYSAGNPNGTIAGSTLLAQTRRHEYDHPTASHYGEWSNSIASTNLGDITEALIGGPGTDGNAFAAQIRTAQTNVENTNTSAASVEPPGVNLDAAGTYLGNICYAPYTDCQ